MADDRRNIVIVGGGIIGCTTAYFLTRHPKFNPALHKITLLEAAPSIASGASGKAGGLLALWAYPSSIVPLSYRLHAELAAEHNGAQKWGYRELKCGSIECKVSKDKIQQLQASNGDGKAWEKLPKQNDVAKGLFNKSARPDDLDWIDKEAVKEYYQMGGAGRADTAQAHPYHFTTSMAQLAQEAGVDIRTKAKVTNLTMTDSGVQGVEYLDRDGDETKELKDVTDIMVAAGPWTSRILPKANVQGLRAHSVVYEADVSAHAIFTDIKLPSDFVPEHRAKMGQKRKHTGNVDPEVYPRPFNEVYACGEPDHAVPLPDTADLVECDEAQCDDITSYLSTVSPVLASAPIKAKQACYLPQHLRFGKAIDPMIGATSIPGLWVAAGHTCWGIQNGPGTGKLMSEFIFDGEATSADVSRLSPKAWI